MQNMDEPCRDVVREMSFGLIEGLFESHLEIFDVARFGDPLIFFQNRLL